MSTALLRKDAPSLSSPVAAAVVMFILALPALLHRGGDIRKRLGAALSGSMFAAGLGISGMTQTSKVNGFLCFSLIWAGRYDPTLVCVLGSGILASVASYQLISGYGKYGTLQKPLNQPKGSTFSAIPTNQTIDNRLVMGSFLFGVGWGLTGICPGKYSSYEFQSLVLWPLKTHPPHHVYYCIRSRTLRSCSRCLGCHNRLGTFILDRITLWKVFGFKYMGEAFESNKEAVVSYNVSVSKFARKVCARELRAVKRLADKMN